jgi:hypothetical protein
MMQVDIDSVWSVLDTHRQRVEFTVKRVATENGERRAFGVLASGREHSFTVSALARGRRGARLLRSADGHVPYVPPADMTTEITKTASDYRRTIEPKGISKAAPHMEEAFRMRMKGASIREIAAHFGGVPASRVATWVRQARERREDEANLKAMEERT